MDKAPSIWLLVLFCALAPVPVQAQYTQITAITVTPSPAFPGEEVSISVDVVVGQGNCLVTLDYGDERVRDPFLPPHTSMTWLPGLVPIPSNQYFGSATLTATAPPHTNCVGSAMATLPVSNETGPRRALHCFLYGCNPSITAIPFPSIIRPGGGVIFQGSGFGQRTGSVWIVLQSSGGNPIRNALQIDSWQPSLVTATIPDISGVTNQTATFQIITGNSSGSNAFHLPFTATRDFIPLEASRIFCSTKFSSSDSCQNVGNTDTAIECSNGLDTWGTGVTGYYGYHSSGWQVLPGSGDSGIDLFYILPFLTNGWVTSDQTFDYVSNHPSPSAQIVGQFTPGTAFPSPWSVSWNADGCGRIEYYGDIFIVGPKDVPH